MTQAAYDSWIWFQLNPEDKPDTAKRQQIKDPNVWVDPIHAAENMAFINMTAQQREDADTKHLEKYGIYF